LVLDYSNHHYFSFEIYSFLQEFEAQVIESRIGHLTGTGRDAEEKEANEKKIAELEEVLSEKMASFNLLTAQNQRLEVYCLHKQ
jgi:hypothetical protein